MSTRIDADQAVGLILDDSRRLTRDALVAQLKIVARDRNMDATGRVVAAIVARLVEDDLLARTAS